MCGVEPVAGVSTPDMGRPVCVADWNRSLCHRNCCCSNIGSVVGSGQLWWRVPPRVGRTFFPDGAVGESGPASVFHFAAVRPPTPLARVSGEGASGWQPRIPLVSPASPRCQAEPARCDCKFAGRVGFLTSSGVVLTATWLFTLCRVTVSGTGPSVGVCPSCGFG